MKNLLLTTTLFAAIVCTSCNPPEASNSNSSSETPQTQIDTAENKTHPAPRIQDSTGRVADPASLKQ